MLWFLSQAPKIQTIYPYESNQKPPGFGLDPRIMTFIWMKRSQQKVQFAGGYVAN